MALMALMAPRFMTQIFQFRLVYLAHRHQHLIFSNQLILYHRHLLLLLLCQ